MKLEKFKDHKTKNKQLLLTIIFAVFFIVIDITIQKTFANFKETKTFNVIEGTVKYEGTGDVYVAAYIDGVQTSGSFPDKTTYAFDHAECNNDAVIEFDKAAWTGNVSNLNSAKTKCNIYFITREQANLISNKIKYFAESDTTNLAYDGTADNNLRYIGKNPNNYITFNGELWRIIGVFNNIDDGTGKLEWRTKIIRNQSIGNKSWDTDSANGGYGINEWSTADIKIYLNDTYYPKLTQGAKDMIGDTTWNLGTNGNADYTSAITSTFYEYERSNNTGKICSSGTYCNDTVIRTTKWTGKIGLMYPSDYGYATGGNTRSSCLNEILYMWNNNVSCYNNNWLFNNDYQFTITPTTYYSAANRVFGVCSDGYVDYRSADAKYGIRPTIYLSSNVTLTSGSGTSTDPYQLSV